jgi:hypothetical protein
MIEVAAGLTFSSVGNGGSLGMTVFGISAPSGIFCKAILSDPPKRVNLGLHDRFSPVAL